MQLERVEEEKLNLRKQLIERRCKDKASPLHLGAHDITSASGGAGGGEGEESVDGDPVNGSSDGGRTVAELRKRVRGLEQRCESERRQTKLLQREKDSLAEQLNSSHEQVYR